MLLRELRDHPVAMDRQLTPTGRATLSGRTIEFVETKLSHRLNKAIPPANHRGDAASIGDVIIYGLSNRRDVDLEVTLIDKDACPHERDEFHLIDYLSRPLNELSQYIQRATSNPHRYFPLQQYLALGNEYERSECKATSVHKLAASPYRTVLRSSLREQIMQTSRLSVFHLSHTHGEPQPAFSLRVIQE